MSSRIIAKASGIASRQAASCTKAVVSGPVVRTYISGTPLTTSLSRTPLSTTPFTSTTSTSLLSLSTPTKTRTSASIESIRIFSTTTPVQDDSGHHFDTHRFVEKLEREGFTRQQSEAIMNALDEVVTESMDNLTRNMVTKADQDKTVYTYKVDFAALKSELQMLEKNDFSLTNTNNERLVSEIEKLRQRLREEVARTQAGVRLDLNLEKGRIRDEAATQELKVRATEERIEQEIAALRTQMETIKLQTLQYMIGTITGAGALILAYLRMFK
ncbi:hypothetical protein BGZ89_006717 [Linnemannia elongata]|nr:hypothetical protein BGZ89_006717 [Linnemannia elongata]